MPAPLHLLGRTDPKFGLHLEDRAAHRLNQLTQVEAVGAQVLGGGNLRRRPIRPGKSDAAPGL